MTKKLNDECEGDTARYAAIMAADTRFMPHENGHTKYILFYRGVIGGRALAIEKRKGVPSVYVSSSLRSKSAYPFGNAKLKASSLTERNSNLRKIFSDEELFQVKPANDTEFLAIGACAA